MDEIKNQLEVQAFRLKDQADRLKDQENRMREQELKFVSLNSTIGVSKKSLGVFGVVVLAWLGANTFVQIPKSIDKLIADAGIEDAEAKIDTLLSSAILKSNAVAEISKEGETITIGGQCFKPKTLVRCFRGKGNHLTWVDNPGECTADTYEIKGQIAILAGC